MPEPERVPAAAGSTSRRRLAALVPTVPRGIRTALTASLVTAIFFWSFASDDGFSMIARAFPGARPVKAVKTTQPEVGLIVDAPPALAPDVARELEHDGATATVAVTSAASGPDVAAVRDAGSELMPRLKPGGPVHWIGTRGQLAKTARSLGIHGHFYYAAPHDGFTLAQDLLGKTAGATPVSCAHRLKEGASLGSLERGDLVEVSIDDHASWRPWLDAVTAQMRARGLHATSATGLLRAGPDER